MTRRLFRSLVAGIALLSLLAGVPALLVTFGRSPLDGDGALLEQLTSLPTQAISDRVAFGLLTVGSWIAWASFTYSAAIELANALGSAAAWRPLGWNPFELTARRLVTALTMSVSLSTSIGARAGGLPTLPPATAADPGHVADGAGHAASDELGLSEPLRGARRAAVGAVSDVRLWWSPKTGSPGSDPSPPTTSSPSDLSAESSVVTVAPGDSPWALAEQHLGNGFRWRELWDLNRGVIQPDGRAWVTEDLIRPGWQLRLPVAPVDLPLPEPSAGSTGEPPEESPSETCPSADTPSDQTDGTRSDDAARPQPPASASTTSTTTEPAEREPPAARPSSPSTSTDRDDPGSERDLPVPLGELAGATVLATSLALLTRSIRRRSAIRSARGWRRPPEPTATGRAIEGAADVPLVRWAGQELAAAMLRIEPEAIDGACPVAVELSEERGIELLWDRPVRVAPMPWQATDHGWTWSLAYDPDATVPPDRCTSPIPALVAIGDREGRQLMIDLEAFGSVSVVGDPVRVASFVRAIALELAADEDLADAYVTAVGVAVGPVDSLPRLKGTAPDDALARLLSTVSAVDASLQDSSQKSTFGYRITEDGAYLEAAIVLVDGRGDLALRAAFVDASPARRGVGTVVLGEAPTAGAVISISADGLAVLEPLGVTFRAAGLGAEAEQQVADLLREQPADLSEGVTQFAAVRMDEGTTGSTENQPSTDSDDHSVGPVGSLSTEQLLLKLPGRAAELPDAMSVPHDPDTEEVELGASSSSDGSLLVKVLGTPRVPDRPGLRRRELVLTVYMACRARPVTPSGIQNAIWGGRAVEPKTLWNVIARTRTSLGDLEDGTPAMPPNDRRSGTLHLSDRVITDLALLEACYSHAQGLPPADAMNVLRRGLALIEGEPFDAAGYEWAYRDDQYVAEASTLIERAVEYLVGLATAAGDYGVAREALSQGLRGLPGNEVLYRARMQLEHTAGNVSGIESAWNELTSFLLDLDMEPSDETVALHTKLTRGG